MENLFKYTSSETALKILIGQNIRYSKPSKFNDPFDCNINLIDSYRGNINGFVDDLGKEIIKQFNGRIDNYNSEKFLKEFFNHPDFSTESIEAKLKSYTDTLNGVIKNNFNLHYILCLTEHHSNLLMWSHYADNHKGMVIKIKKMKELNNLIIASKKVSYSDNFPSSIHVQKSINLFLKKTTSEEVAKNFFNKLFLTKGTSWRYEDEHRVIIPEYKDYGDYRDYSLHKEEIDSVYLGCRMNNNDKNYFIKIIKERYPHTKIFEMSISSSKFQLTEKLIS